MFKAKQVPWNKWLKGFSWWWPKWKKRTKENIEKIKKMARERKRSPLSPETIAKIVASNTWRKRTVAARLKMSLAKRWSKSLWWKWWICGENEIIRKSLQYKEWRESVWHRDDYICCKCCVVSHDCNSHHVFNFAEYPILRLDIRNGITFCKSCHQLFHAQFWNKHNTPEQVELFIGKKLTTWIYELDATNPLDGWTLSQIVPT